MKKNNNRFCIILHLTLLFSFFLVMGVATASDFSWSDAARVVASNHNPGKNLTWTAYDSARNKIHEETLVRHEPESEEPDFTSIKGSDSFASRERALEECNNSCDIFYDDTPGGDIVVVHNNSGVLREFSANEGGGYECSFGCDDAPAPPPGDGGSDSESGSGGSGTGDTRYEGVARCGADNSESRCFAGAGKQCWEEGQQIKRCGGGSPDSLGQCSKVNQKIVCLGAIMHTVSCDSEDTNGYWTPLKIKSYRCLTRFVAPRGSKSRERAQEACGHLVSKPCDGGNEPCPDISCPMDSLSTRPLYDSDGKFIGYCDTCSDPQSF